MYYVYILKSITSNIYYTGIAMNPESRLKEHNRGKSKFTKGHLPWKIIHQEGPYETKKARNIEKNYKTTSGKEKLDISPNLKETVYVSRKKATDF